MSVPLRIFYAAGPGDVVGTYRHWSAGRDDPSQVAMTYSGQFYELCARRGATGRVVSSNRNRLRLVDGRFNLEHRPIPFESGPSALYHAGQVWAAARLIASAVRFRAEVAVVANGSCHWFPLLLLRAFGVKIVPSMHCVLWPKGKRRGRLKRAISWLDGVFFKRGASAVLCLSRDIQEQLDAITGGGGARSFDFIPTYRVESFADLGAAPAASRPFRVFFAGRIEKNKGVFDLLEIAKRFAREGRSEIEFDLCGDGSALPALRSAAEAAGVETRFRCHGHSTRPAMREMYRQCHVVIVPTTSDFIEGFNKVVAEGVLAGRPVITSNVCPALDVVGAGVVEVPVDDVTAYGNAILRLCDDRDLYEQKRLAALELRDPFHDQTRGWGAALDRALAYLGHAETPPQAEAAPGSSGSAAQSDRPI